MGRNSRDMAGIECRNQQFKLRFRRRQNVQRVTAITIFSKLRSNFFLPGSGSSNSDKYGSGSAFLKLFQPPPTMFSIVLLFFFLLPTRDILRRNPHQHPLLYLKGVTHRDLESVLNFMYQAVLCNRKRNRRNRNFLTSGTGTVLLIGRNRHKIPIKLCI
jgi:hypothetical protein